MPPFAPLLTATPRVDHEPHDAEDGVRLRAAARIADGPARRGRGDDDPAAVVANVVARDQANTPLGTGSLIAVEDGVLELRSLFVRSDAREAGVGSALLRELEAAAVRFGAPAVVAGTDTDHAVAVAFLTARGYQLIAPFGAHAADPRAVCLAKVL